MGDGRTTRYQTKGILSAKAWRWERSMLCSRKGGSTETERESGIHEAGGLAEPKPRGLRGSQRGV